MTMNEWGPSPVDVDDIHDYYNAQQLSLYLSTAKDRIDKDNKKSDIIIILNIIIVGLLWAYFLYLY